MSLMKSALNRRMRVTKSAFDKVRKNTGQETYKPLEIYTKMKPEDFSVIAEKYGMDEVVRYIQVMENLRMKGKNNG